MSGIKRLMIINAVIDCLYIVCVTVAAISFQKSDLCWWYLLLPFLGYRIRYTKEDAE